MTGVAARALLRLPAAAVVLLLAGTLIYGFGAGYFWPLGLPTPLNVAATVVLSFLALRWAWRYVSAPVHKGPAGSASA